MFHGSEPDTTNGRLRTAKWIEDFKVNRVQDAWRR